MTYPIATTLKALRETGACYNGYNKLASHLSGANFDPERNGYMVCNFDSTQEISLETIAENNGINDALWSLSASNASDRDMRLFAVWSARQVQYLMKDERSINALDVAEKFANGNATEEELTAARDAARDAAWDAAWDAARDAASAAASAAAWAAASAAAWDAASAAAWDAQKEMFIKMCNGQAPWQQVEVK